jgi:two-component system sensor histidine kinase SenX3
VESWIWPVLVVTALVVGVLLGLNNSTNPEPAPGSQEEEQIKLVVRILDVIPDVAFLMDSKDRVVSSSSNCAVMGLCVGQRVGPAVVRAMNREVFKHGTTLMQDSLIERSEDRLGDYEARIRVSSLDRYTNLAIVQDLSEERRLNDVRRDFVANVSHELKTPVGALGLLAEAISMAEGDPEQTKKFTSRMQTEVRRLTELIRDLVELSRVQGGEELRNAEAFWVDSMLHEAADATALMAQEKNIEVVVASELPHVQLLGDEQQVITAVRNLITNAVAYSPEHTRVGVGINADNGWVEISVTDQGPGIPENELARIFERFYRVDPARSRVTGGTGLGLAIVRHVCANHGGECNVWSQVGIGSTFTLRFPIYQSSESSQETA